MGMNSVKPCFPGFGRSRRPTGKDINSVGSVLPLCFMIKTILEKRMDDLWKGATLSIQNISIPG